MNLSQEEFAAALRAAGAASGEPNDATKRLVQRWESGVSASARPIYRRALQAVTGLTYPELGFADTRRSRPESCDLAHLDADIVGGSIGESIGRSIGAEREMGFPEPGERVGARFLAWVSARTERYRKLDDFLGGADTVDLYCDDVRRTARVLRQGRYSEEVGRELARIVAQQAQQAGWAAFDTGVERHTLEGVSVRIYSAARTVADCFKFRSYVGMEIAVDALREGLAKRAFSPADVFEYAEVDRVQNVILPYMEALT